MNQRRSRLSFRSSADVGPEFPRKTDILDKFFFTADPRRRTHDESTGQPGCDAVDDSFSGASVSSSESDFFLGKTPT